MRTTTFIALGIFLAGCATPAPRAEPIPPLPPVFAHAAPTPPFVSDAARLHASRVLETASTWRPPGTLIVAVVSDLNPSYGKTTYGPQVAAAAHWIVDGLRPDLVLSAGDMVAGQKAGLDYLAMWRGFDRAFYETLEAGGYPLYVAPGNHDGAAGGGYVRERAVYREVWEARRPAREFLEGSNWPFYYAFEEDGAVFIALDATTVGPLGEVQRDWLFETLEREASARATVVFGHVPPLPFAIGREWEVLADPEVESAFERFGVDVVVTGHHHAYYPGRKGSVRYVGAAALGSGPRQLIGHKTDSPRGVTVITLSGDGSVHVEARIAPGFERVIEHAELPPYIDHEGRRLERDDVAAERAENP